MKVNVFQDGKICRNVPGIILERRSNQILIEFVVSDWVEEEYLPVTMTRWFKRRRRDNGGVYECHNLNYWYYADRNVKPPSTLPDHSI